MTSDDGTLGLASRFEPDAFYALTLLEDGEGVAEASPPLHTEGYGLGESIVLEATPDLGWAFDHWLDNSTGNVVSYQSIFEVRAKETNSYTAVFRALNSLTLTTIGQGRVVRTSNSLIYEEDASVTLTPAANPGWKFTGWTGDATGTDNPLQLTMDSPKEITASFAPDFNVQVDINDDGLLNDDEYEQQVPGEVMRISDLQDNGVGYGAWHFQQNAESYYQPDDTQPLVLTHPPEASIYTLDVSIAGLPQGVSLYFTRGRLLPFGTVGPKRGAIDFPYDSEEQGPLPNTIYMLARGNIVQNETFCPARVGIGLLRWRECVGHQ